METKPTETPLETELEAGHESQTGLDENVAGALAYLFGFVTGILLLVVDGENEFVRFHAAQSIAVFGLLFGASVLLGVVGAVVGALFASGSTGAFLVGTVVSLVLTLGWLALGLASFALWAYQGETPRVPLAAGLADRIR
jgi:uncharacterized membrane protein